MRPTVLFVDHDRGRSGATVSMEYLIRTFSGAGWRVLVLSPKHPKEAGCIVEAGGKVIPLNTPGINSLGLNLHFTDSVPSFSADGLVLLAKNVIKFFVGIAVICRAVRRLRIGLVYPNEYVVIQGSVAGFLCRVPSVLHVRSLMLRGAFGIRRRLLSFLILSCNWKVFAISRLEGEQIAGSGKRRGKIEVIEEFVDAAESHDEEGMKWRVRIGVSGKKVLVTMVGGISPLKGSLEFLLGAERVFDSRPDTVFALAGTLEPGKGPANAKYSEECMRIASTLRDAGALHILGFVEDPLNLIAGSDILVVPSTLTHFSRPVIEAWSCARPVVVSATEHMKELVDDGRDGLFFPVGDADGLARTLLALIDDEEMRRRLGLEGQRKARARFDAVKNTGRILECCWALLHE